MGISRSHMRAVEAPGPAYNFPADVLDIEANNLLKGERKAALKNRCTPLFSENKNANPPLAQRRFAVLGEGEGFAVMGLKDA